MTPLSSKIKVLLHQPVLFIICFWHRGVFTRQLLIVFPDLIPRPLSFPSRSFHLVDAATQHLSLPSLVKSPPAKYAVTSKVLFSSPPLPVSPSLPPSLTYFSPIFPFFPSPFSLKAQEQPVLSEEIQALPKNSLNLLYNWSLGGKRGVESGIK